MHRFKLVLTLLLILLLSTLTVSAQDGSVTVGSFEGSPTLLLAAIIGIITSAVTLTFAYRIKGGIVGQSLLFIGSGMLLVVLGFVAVIFSWSSAQIQGLTHDVLFILGYILMLVGAFRLRQLA